jgi:hypothetical protein
VLNILSEPAPQLIIVLVAKLTGMSVLVTFSFGKWYIVGSGIGAGRDKNGKVIVVSLIVGNKSGHYNT